MRAVQHMMTAGFMMGVLAVAACSHGGGEETMTNSAKRVVRRAAGGGRWFPGSRKELEPMVSGFISSAQVPPVNGRIVGVIAPHAGYIYSGKVAGYAFRAIQDNATGTNKPETVVVLGFSHRAGFPGVALMDGDAIETPLGEARLDKAAAEMLVAGRPRISFNYAPHAGEHSAENEIPFVQSVLPDAGLIVAIIGDHDSQTMKDLVAGLGELAGKRRILVVASSDMLHDPDYELVSKTDKETLEAVKAMDGRGVLKRWDYSRQVFCGIGPVLAVMQFAEAQGCKKGTVLQYRNSGDDFPESRGQWVVGYGAVVFAAPGDN